MVFATAFSLFTSVNYWTGLSKNTIKYRKYAQDHFQNLTNYSLVHNLPVPKFYFKNSSTHSFVGYLV